MSRPTLASFLLALGSLAGSLTSHAQTPVSWSEPASGAWSEAERWSPAVVPINGAPTPSSSYDVTIDAVGQSYEVTSNSDVTVDRVTLNSPDATLQIDGGRFSAPSGIAVNEGQLRLTLGTLANTRLSGSGEVVAIRNSSIDEFTFENVTLATTLGGPSSLHRLRLPTGLQLDNGALHSSGIDLRLIGDAGITGVGEILVTPDAFNCCSPDAWMYIDGDNPAPQIGSGVAVRAQDDGWLRIDDWYQQTGSATLINRGLIEADSGRIEIADGTQLRNEGSLRAVNGGWLSINGFAPGSAVGDLEIGPGSQVHLYSFYYDNDKDYGYQFDQPVTIPAGAQLSLTGWWNSATTITVDGGTLRVRTNTPTSGDWVFANGATLQLDGGTTAQRLADFEPTAATRITFTSGSELWMYNETWNLNDIPGQWNLNNVELRGGTLTGLPGSNEIALGGGSMTFDDVRLQFPLSVASGIAVLQGTTSVEQGANIAGGMLILQADWSNPGGIDVTGGVLRIDTMPASLGSIQVSGGELSLPALPATPGQIAITGGDLRANFNFTLSQLRALPWAPDKVIVARTLDLQGGELDLGADLWSWSAAQTGRISNGSIVDSLGVGPLEMNGGTLTDVTATADLEGVGSRLTVNGASTLVGNRLLGQVSVASTVTLDGAIVEGHVRFGTATGGSDAATIRNGLTINGTAELGTARLRLMGSQNVGGAGEATTDGIRSLTGGGFETIDGNLALGPGFTFRSGRRGSVLLAEQGDIVNHGTIAAAIDDYSTTYNDVLGPTITLRTNSLAQLGRIKIADKSDLLIDADTATNDGEIVLEGGKLLLGDTPLVNRRGGIISGFGAVEAVGGNLTNEGTVAPGLGIGILATTGPYIQTTPGVLEIELGGETPGVEHDRLDVADAQLGGTLRLLLSGGFTPAGGDSFTVVSASGQLIGAFDAVEASWLANNQTLHLEQTPTSIVVSIVEQVTGDFDSDGDVDGRDLLAWQRTVGTTATPAGTGPDADGNGVVDAADLGPWREEFGANAGSNAAPSTTAVPEPYCLILSMQAAVYLTAARRRGLALAAH